MIYDVVASRLIQELLADPRRFFDQGRANTLLQEYFNGFPTETLRPLLAHTDVMVRRAAVWIASELGQEARILIGDVIPLVRERDRYIHYYALEIITVNAEDEYVDEFVHVVNALTSSDDTIRVLAMDLVSRAHPAQLRAASRLGERLGPSALAHNAGLSVLLRDKNIKPQEILAMLNSEEPVARKYGAIAARRTFADCPELMAVAIASSDLDIREFAKEGEREPPESGVKE